MFSTQKRFFNRKWKSLEYFACIFQQIYETFITSNNFYIYMPLNETSKQATHKHLIQLARTGI